MAKNKTLKAKITLTDFRPDRIKAEKEDVRRMLLGTLIGRATGIVTRTSPDKTTKFEGLGGDFEMHVIGDDGPASSGVLFMPDTFTNPIIGMLSDEVDKSSGEIIKPGAAAVILAYKVFAVRANNPQGRSWELEAISDPKAEEPVDHLSAIRGLLEPQAQLEAPKEKAPAKR